MITWAIVAALAVLAVRIAQRLDTRQPHEMLTFADWWKELRICYHMHRADLTYDRRRACDHMIRANRLMIDRKALMWDVLAGTRHGD